MAKTCLSCGKEYKGEFCEHCGYGDPGLVTHAADKYKTAKAVRYMDPEEKEQYYAALKKKEAERRRTGKTKRDPKQVRLLIIAAVLVLGIIIWTLAGSGAFGSEGSSAEVIDKFFTAVNERDFDKYAKCHSKEQERAILEDLKASGLTERGYMDEFCSVFSELYGDDFKVSYKINRTEPLTSYNMEEYRAAYGTVPNISEAQLVLVDVTFSGSEGEETFTMNASAARIGLGWKLLDLDFAPGVITPDMMIE